jgi:CubicO group peptidase (beta-lactamase class C family)
MIGNKEIWPLIILTFLFWGCGKPSLDKPAFNRLASNNVGEGQTDTIYKFTNRFPDNTQVAICIISDGKASFYGIQRKNDTLIDIRNSDQAFEIGSITKVFTATILANFVVDGKIKSEDKINPNFPFPFHKNLEITYKELANHTSGLPRLPSNIFWKAIFNPSDPYKKYDENKLDEYLKNDISLDYPKGSRSEYSNLGMGLVSYALRKFSGKTYEQLANDLIFKKYKMQHSSTEKTKVQNILIEGLNEDGEPTPNWTAGALIGAGGIYSTVEDLSKFALAQFDSTNLELNLTRDSTFSETKTRDVGLGWFIIKRKNGDRWYWHNGGTGGYTSSMVLDIKNKNGIILLSNLSSYHSQFENIDQLAFGLMKTLTRKIQEP